MEKSKTEKKLEKEIEKVEGKEVKAEEKKEEKEAESKENKKPEKKATTVKERPKKTEAVVNANGLPISTKHSMAVCKFIKNKRISTAIKELEQVAKLKRAIPMKGEIPHRKGKGMMAGRFPKKASESFILILKSLNSNAIYNGIEDPVIVEAVPNMASRPHGRFGAYKKKRTNVRVVAKS